MLFGREIKTQQVSIFVQFTKYSLNLMKCHFLFTKKNKHIKNKYNT